MSAKARRATWVPPGVVLPLGGIAALIVAATVLDAPRGMREHGGFVAVAAALGVLVGASELVSRYRDEPLHAVGTAAAGTYMALNALIAAATYGILTRYGASILPGIAGDRLMTGIVAGLGAMAILRSKFFTFRSERGEDVSIGPDAVVSAFLQAADRGVDRARASRRLQLVFDRSSRIRRPDAGREFLQISLAAFQNLSADERAEFVKYLDAIADSPYSDRLKLQAISYGILNLAGERNFVDIMQHLEAYVASLPETPAQPPGAVTPGN